MRELSSDPEEREVLQRMVTAFGNTARKKRLQPDDLANIVAAVKHPALSVRGMSITRLAVLTHYFDEAADALAELVDHPDSSIREFAVAACANTPPPLAVRVLSDALHDPAWTVRKAAARVTSAIMLPEARALIEDALERERDARVRIALELAVRFQVRASGH